MRAWACCSSQVGSSWRCISPSASRQALATPSIVGVGAGVGKGLGRQLGVGVGLDDGAGEGAGDGNAEGGGVGWVVGAAVGAGRQRSESGSALMTGLCGCGRWRC